MSDDEAAFMRTILAEPDDDAPRLVFADWLDEHGQAERAEYIRLACGGGNPERQAELLQANLEGWLARLPRDLAGAWWSFDRGLPTTLVIGDGTRFAASPQADAALNAASTLTFGFGEPSGMVSEDWWVVFRRPDLGSVSRLDLSFVPLRSVYIALSGIASHLHQLRVVNAAGCQLDNAGLYTLLAHPGVDHLVELRLAHNQLDDDSAVLLADLPLFNLRRLDLSYNEIGNVGATALARSTRWPNLRELVLDHNVIDDIGADALATPAVTSLEMLRLCDNDVTPGVARTLAAVPFRVETASVPDAREPDGGIVLDRPPTVRLWWMGALPRFSPVSAWWAVWLWPFVGGLRGVAPSISAALLIGGFGPMFVSMADRERANLTACWGLLGIAVCVGAMAGVIQCVEPSLTRLAASRWRLLIGVGLTAGVGWLSGGLVAALVGLILTWLGVTIGVRWWGGPLGRRPRDWTAFVVGFVLLLAGGGLVAGMRFRNRWSSRWYFDGHRRTWSGIGLLAVPILLGVLAGTLGGVLSAIGQPGATVALATASGAFVGACVTFQANLVVGGAAPGYSALNPDAAILDQEVYNVSVAGAGGSAIAFLVAWQGGLLGLASAPWSAWASLAGVFLASAIGASVAVGKPTRLFRQMRTAIRHRQRLWG